MYTVKFEGANYTSIFSSKSKLICKLWVLKNWEKHINPIDYYYLRSKGYSKLKIINFYFIVTKKELVKWQPYDGYMSK